MIELVSHPVRVRGLKRFCDSVVSFQGKSHPVRVRGLKRSFVTPIVTPCVSHPVRVRGLKPKYLDCRNMGALRRTPCGCVD